MFQSKTVPSMTIKNYFQRLARYTGCSQECMVLAMLNLSRIYRTHTNFVVNALTVHRLLLASVLCSAKFFDDSFLNNARYARIGGVTTKELNSLEIEFLFLIDFNLFYSVSEYNAYYHELVTTNYLYLASAQGSTTPMLMSVPPSPSASPCVSPMPSPKVEMGPPAIALQQHIINMQNVSLLGQPALGSQAPSMAYGFGGRTESKKGQSMFTFNTNAANFCSNATSTSSGPTATIASGTATLATSNDSSSSSSIILNQNYNNGASCNTSMSNNNTSAGTGGNAQPNSATPATSAASAFSSLLIKGVTSLHVRSHSAYATAAAHPSISVSALAGFGRPSLPLYANGNNPGSASARMDLDVASCS
jgi:hypothetical protein